MAQVITDGPGHLKRFDFAVANPPFSDKATQPANKPSRHSTGDASGLDRFALRCSSGE